MALDGLLRGVNLIVGRKLRVAFAGIATAVSLPSVFHGSESDKPRPDHEVSAPVDVGGKHSPAPEVSTLIKQAFPYDPAAAKKKEETKDMEPDAQVVTMEAFTVVESTRLRQLGKKIESENEKMRAEKFSITKGGTILKKDIGRTRVELGTWPAGTVIIFLKITW